MANETVKKLYTEQYIRDTADAIRLLTGSTEPMTVGQFAEAIRTYVDPNDLTNTKKVRFTMTAWIYSNTDGPAVRLRHINFIDAAESNVYLFTNQNRVTSNITPQYGDTALNRLIDNYDDGYSGSFCSFSGAMSIPKIVLEYNFGIPIDLTAFDNIEFMFHWSGGGWEWGRNAVPTSISIDVLTGDSEFYTSLIKNKNVSWTGDASSPYEAKKGVIVLPHD